MDTTNKLKVMVEWGQTADGTQGWVWDSGEKQEGPNGEQWHGFLALAPTATAEEIVDAIEEGLAAEGERPMVEATITRPPRALPVLTIRGERWIADQRLHELRAEGNPHKVKRLTGGERDLFGLYIDAKGEVEAGEGDEDAVGLVEAWESDAFDVEGPEEAEDFMDVLADAVTAGERAFFAALAATYPIAKTGDLRPEHAEAFTAACRAVVLEWTRANVPGVAEALDEGK